MTRIPESHVDLLERPVVVALVTVQPDGQPQATPIWADLVDGRIRVNTAVGRQKWKNMVERPVATVLAIDPENPYRWMEVRGRVTGSTTDGAEAVIDKLAKDYTGVDVYPDHRADEQRITFFIEPHKVIVSS